MYYDVKISGISVFFLSAENDAGVNKKYHVCDLSPSILVIITLFWFITNKADTKCIGCN